MGESDRNRGTYVVKVSAQVPLEARESIRVAVRRELPNERVLVGDEEIDIRYVGPDAGRCRNCKNWKFTPPREGVCRMGTTTAGAKHDASTLAWAEADQRHSDGELLTRPEFGCIMWESSE